jgi:hypothetical protein
MMSTYVKDRLVPLVTPYRARRRRLLALAVLTAVPLAGCGAPPELDRRTDRPAPPTATGTPSATATASPAPTPSAAPPLPTATPDTGTVAVACRNGPSKDRIIRLVRGAAGVLPNGGVTVRTGPLCADDWQYAVLAVSGYEDLTVVTRGRPEALTLVTAGTDVCTIEVRTSAPTGIRTLACDGTGVVPGA